MEVISSKIVKNRKEHQCCPCRRKIGKGEKMRTSTNKDGDDIWEFRNCMTCDELMRGFEDEFIDHSEGAFPEGCVDDRLIEYEVNNPEELLQELKKQ